MGELLSDRQQYESILQGFVGQVCGRTIACNSIKLRFENGAKRGYIWIDPPWSFTHHHQFITSAELCPHYEDEDYESSFRGWCDLFTPLDQTTLTAYEFASDESLTLFFPDRYALHIPAIESEQEDSWYSHWYAALSNHCL